MAQRGAPPAVELVGVRKRYGDTVALAGIDLAVGDGEFLALLGPSGCGKSTTLRIIAGLDLPTSGQVLFAGRDVTHRTPAARNVAMVFQSYALYPHFSVAQNIALPLAMARLSRLERLPGLRRFMPSARDKQAAIGEEVRRAATALAIGELLHRKPSQLSGGQKQRVALARALVRAPSVFLLDEPLSNLDARLRVATRDELVALHRQTGRSFVYVTHDQAEAMAMADRIAVFRDGAIVQVGTPEDVHDRPADAWVAGFVGERPIALIPTEARPGSGALKTPFRDVVLPGFAGPLTVGLRPEAVSLSGDPMLSGEVERAEYLGSGTVVSVRVGAVTVRAHLASGTPRPRDGERVGLSFDATRALLFGSDGSRLEHSQRFQRTATPTVAVGA